MLQAELKERIEKITGKLVEPGRLVQGGYSPALRLVCKTTQGSFFVKVGVTPLTSKFLRQEIRVYQRVAGEFMPKVFGWDEQEEEPILVIEDLSGWRWPPPWDAKLVDRVLGQVEAMHATQAAGLETFAQAHGKPLPNWQSVADNPGPFLSLGMAGEAWLQAALPALIWAEAQCEVEGESLTHFDLRSDNMCALGERVVMVDWNWACRANPKLDTGFWLPSLAYEGGPEPELIMADAPEVAAWVSGFFASKAGRPGIPDAPRVRLVQRQQLETALPWAVRALGLPALR